MSSTAQDRTLDQYHSLMQINASAHLLRTAREVGVLDLLREGQRTEAQLCQSLSLVPEATALLVDALVALGILERYGDDLALSRAGHLLCQYDQDLGDRRWERLSETLRGAEQAEVDDPSYFDRLAATQWVHTAAAMQAAEVLDLGGDQFPPGPRILDLGCGSAVWSCAMAHRDPQATVLAVDTAAALEAASRTAESIGLGERFETIAADPLEFRPAAEQFDLVVLAQRLSGLDAPAAQQMLSRAAGAAKSGGRLVVLDLFRGPSRPTLTESVEALALELDSRVGRMRTLQEIQRDLVGVGLRHVQFTFLAASRSNLGLAVGVKGDDST